MIARALLLVCGCFLAPLVARAEPAPAKSGVQTPATSPCVATSYDLANCSVRANDSALAQCISRFLSCSLSSESKGYRSWTRDQFARTDGRRATGPLIAGTSASTHSRARVYYSKPVVDWLTAREKNVHADLALPAGAAIVKEMFVEDPTLPEPNKVTGWTVMLKDPVGSRDGWVWMLNFLPDNATNHQEFKALSHGMSFCMACHASADNKEQTFAFLGNIQDRGVQTYAFRDLPPTIEGAALPTGKSRKPVRDSNHAKFANNFASCTPNTPPPAVNPAIAQLFWQRAQPNSQFTPKAFPMDLYANHVPVAAHNTDAFLSADDCSGCHDASALAGNLLPEMTLQLAKPGLVEQYNLSPWGEWSASLMGLSARDPVFLAQLESELALHPRDTVSTQAFCLSCHAVQGARQMQLDGDKRPFLKDLLYAQTTPDPTQLQPTPGELKYGALGRNGVACTTCHHISSEGLGTPATWNGNFRLGPTDKVFGPFTDPKTYPMQQSLGVTPAHGAQIGDSALCGSCHTVLVPRIPTDPKGPRPQPQAHEQTTYWEWANSDYSSNASKSPNTSGKAQSCVQCHMPDDAQLIAGQRAAAPDAKLQFRIAGIEDGFFPQVPHRAPFAQITLEPRHYRRHTLVGINVLTQQLFQQFAPTLGYCQFDPAGSLPSKSGGVLTLPIGRLQLANAESTALAGRSVDLELLDVQRGADLTVNARVTNRAGHKFPSGVGFRRAFLQLNVLDKNKQVLWSSGRVNDVGVLVDPAGKALPSEFATAAADLQPDYELITQQTQVQIYEQRHTDDRQRLTTSFLSLFNDVKDNRILPMGWSPTGPYAQATWPIANGGARVAMPVPGIDVVRYRIPGAAIHNAATVELKLFYQSLPPYYLADRFATASGAESDRLFYQVSRLQLKGTSAEGWRLMVKATAAAVPPASR